MMASVSGQNCNLELIIRTIIIIIIIIIYNSAMAYPYLGHLGYTYSMYNH